MTRNKPKSRNKPIAHNEEDLMNFMHDMLVKLDVRLDSVDDRLGAIDVTLAKNDANLADHMRRTELLENELKPIRNAYFGAKGIAKVGLFLVGLATVIKAGFVVLEYFKH